ncbi:MAG: hypothetical protein A3B91_03560 [Candidatus Yanofskybacteria bacterium RIFCSPHIGHO2_02_FULL_41_29]|uniref:Type 4 fimbrial biogenesis protein PilO n=1 Tax=Candidatus Yanofskybacteria bacterium RIFCSPHIGHO2_01_FULL_41_53 TaxID=1802663 RepID=A0A1F8EKM4_9BACT|nr:MAG: hypothetical protein A2650_00785 [Candidatus Yanofskybacteria bacterium RIFCSPHIGHO2_01_FULL_41_53]OGN10835.1 MAG: hypothetical protein A3B91_03560 [Candidatus Yanofskybacteria bacterium RIFCSPHIGHO2_02_FULL_41_29]OGN18553.1 MAG: hypothetical protein A3F48_01255 [Candidatus Yanofskybacteria bacterium RIFCSPHIGHO2_12_FULL_41_9]OGN24501.1 MAG: hypothetical protein A2916_02620 [Candidatus Yanofskybacteria bacterium RIFCSPLOWO2_01_FULL_41_67]OGN29504.1 MAG: hypothetical protein A3H54_01200 
MVQSIKNLIAATLVAISGFLLWTQILPIYELTSSLKPKITERLEFLKTRIELTAKIESLKKERDNRHAEFQRLAIVVPETKSLPELISMLEKMFSQTGNILSGFTIGEVTNEKSLKNIFLDISSSGSYESVLNILNAIENSLRLFDITFLSISEDSGPSNNNRLDFQIKGYIYWLSKEDDSLKK